MRHFWWVIQLNPIKKVEEGIKSPLTTTNNNIPSPNENVKENNVKNSDRDTLGNTLSEPKRNILKLTLSTILNFFRKGLNAITKLWLANGCQESPKEMAEALKAEYRGR